MKWFIGLGKEHSKVLKVLDKIVQDLINKEKSNVASLFINNYYKIENQNRKYREYLLTEDGFLMYIFNIQGYNDFKFEFIQEFRRLQNLLREKQSEEWLQTRKQGKLTRRNETNVIASLILMSKKQGSENADKLYTVYSSLVNKIVKKKQMN